MRSRRKARESALQALYQCDTLGEWRKDCIELYFKVFHRELLEKDPETLDAAGRECLEFCRLLACGVIDNLDFIDNQISSCSTNWSIQRMSRVDRNILRVATYEIAFCAEIPLSVTINEAIEIAKAYGTEDSPVFVNGVLDNVARSIKVREGVSIGDTRKIAAAG